MTVDPIPAQTASHHESHASDATWYVEVDKKTLDTVEVMTHSKMRNMENSSYRAPKGELPSRKRKMRRRRSSSLWKWKEAAGLVAVGSMILSNRAIGGMGDTNGMLSSVAEVGAMVHDFIGLQRSRRLLWRFHGAWRRLGAASRRRRCHGTGSGGGCGCGRLWVVGSLCLWLWILWHPWIRILTWRTTNMDKYLIFEPFSLSVNCHRRQRLPLKASKIRKNGPNPAKNRPIRRWQQKRKKAIRVATQDASWARPRGRKNDNLASAFLLGLGGCD